MACGRSLFRLRGRRSGAEVNAGQRKVWTTFHAPQSERRRVEARSAWRLGTGGVKVDSASPEVSQKLRGCIHCASDKARWSPEARPERDGGSLCKGLRMATGHRREDPPLCRALPGSWGHQLEGTARGPTPVACLPQRRKLDSGRGCSVGKGGQAASWRPAPRAKSQGGSARERLQGTTCRRNEWSRRALLKSAALAHTLEERLSRVNGVERNCPADECKWNSGDAEENTLKIELALVTIGCF